MLYKQLLYVVFCFFYFSVSVNSQINQKQIDSLKNELVNTSGRDKVFLLERIVKRYSFVNMDSSMHYNKKMLALSQEIKDDSLEIYSYNLRGDILHEKAKYTLSVEAYEKALFLNKDYKKLEAYSYNGIANNQSKQENFEDAVETFLKVLDMFESVKDTFMIIGTNFHLANDFRKLKDYDNAELYYQKAIDVNNSKNEFLENFIFNNLSDLYNDMDKPKLSLENSAKALAYFKKMNFEKYIPYPLFNKAVAYEKLGDLDKAKENYLRAIDTYKKYENYFELANSYSSLAALYLRSGKNNKAIIFAKEAINFSNKVQAKEFQISSYKTLSEAYKNNNNFKKSLQYFSIYDSLNNQYFEENKLKITKNLSAKYQTEKKEKELLQTKAEKATAELNLSKQKQFSYALIGGLGILVLLGYSLFQRNKRKHTLALAKEKEIGLQAIIQAEENERSKIARDLHDGVVQQIGSIILKSRNVLSSLKVIDKPESKDLLKSLEDSNQDLRNISHQMMPTALSDLGVISALEDLLSNSLGLTETSYNFEHFNIKERLQKKVEITIYRVTQELINNIIKHSKATEVSVQLFKTGNNVILIVEDNGVGISKENTKKGVGLLNISSRLDMVNGKVNFEPSPQSGTLVTIKIPV